MPEDLRNMDVTEAWGKTKLKEWVIENIPIDVDKILWGRIMKPNPKESQEQMVGKYSSDEV